MQTTLLHILQVPGTAPTAAPTPAGSGIPAAGVPTEFGEALSHAANDLGAPDAGAPGSVAPRVRRGGARGEPAHPAHAEAGIQAPRAATSPSAAQRPAGTDSPQPADPESPEDPALDAAGSEGEASALTPWLAAIVASAAVPGAAASAQAAPANATTDPAPGRALQADGQVDPARKAGSADSLAKPGAAPAPARPTAGEGSKGEGLRSSASGSAGDQPRLAAGGPATPDAGRPAPPDAGQLLRAQRSSSAADAPARRTTELAPTPSASAAPGETAAPPRDRSGGERVMTVQVAGEKVSVQLAPTSAAQASGRSLRATASSQRMPSAPASAATAAAIPGPAGREASVQRQAADAATTAARRSANPAGAQRDAPTPAAGALTGALTGALGRHPGPRGETPGQAPTAGQTAAESVTAAPLPGVTSTRPTQRDTPAGDASGQDALPRLQTGAAAVQTEPVPGSPQAPGTPAPRGQTQAATGAGRPQTAVAGTAPADPSQDIDSLRRRPPQRGAASASEGDVATGRGAMAAAAEVAAVDAPKSPAQRTPLVPPAGEVAAGPAAKAQASDASAPRPTAATVAMGSPAAAQGVDAVRAAASERPTLASTPARADAVRARASHAGSPAAGTARGRGDNGPEGSEAAPSVDAASASGRRGSPAAGPTAPTPTATAPATAASAAAATQMTVPLQAGAAVAEPYRRYVLPQGPADAAAGAARPGAAGVAGLEAARQRRALASTDTEQALRRSVPETATAPAETQAAAWIRALEAAVGGPVGRESRVDELAPAGSGAPTPQETAATEGRTAAAAAESSATAARIDAALNSPEFAPLLGARIAALVRDGIEQARISLNPQEMGPVSVQLALDGSKVSVELAAEVEATRIALEQALPSLAGALHEAGFTLAGGGVFQQSREGSGGATPQEGGAWADRGAAAARGDAQAAAGPNRTAGERATRGLVDLYA